ncbi:FliM/FliN family flagellar motor switch protein [Pseudomonas batumici]|uniref:FliM/FliN family flagellar motor switch protein n=1 Tax=Pseudomonas batumici TaxID=226910 RepID=UPI0030CC1A9B
MNTLPLKRVDPLIARMARNIPVQWRAQVAVSHLRPERQYAVLRWIDGAQSQHGYLDTQQVVDALLDVDAGLPADLFDADLLRQLITEYCSHASDNPYLHNANVEGLQLGSVLTAPVYRLPMGDSDFFVPDLFSVVSPPEPDPQALTALGTRVHWPLAFCLGRSTLTSTELVALAVGDVLLITQRQSTAGIPGRPIFHAHFNGDAFVMTRPFDSEYDLESPLDEFVSLAPDQLPVEIEFILAEREYSLSELCALHEGDVLELPPDTAKRIRIRAGKQPLAEGELVALGEHIGVELTRVHFRSRD